MTAAVKADSAPVITTDSLPNGMLGVNYNQTLTAEGGGIVAWLLHNGVLPDGLSISDVGLISGTPTESGEFTFTIMAQNEEGENEKSLTIVIEDGDLAVSSETGSHTYSYRNNIGQYLTITSPGDYTIGMAEGITETTDYIIVNDVQGAIKLTLNGVNIDNSDNHTDFSEGKPALQIKNTGTTTIELAGDNNILKAGTNHASLENNGNPLVIDGTGSLYAYGGRKAAGIGGAIYKEGSNITINNGNIYAKGGIEGAGIGGGPWRRALNIVINNGTVNAEAGGNAAGIGGGCGNEYQNNTDVTATVVINGGTVTATSKWSNNINFSGGAGIGSGMRNYATGAQVTINGGTVSATGYNNGAAIGEGTYSKKESTLNIFGGRITVTADNIYLDNNTTRILSSQPNFGNTWYQWRTNTTKDVPATGYTLGSAAAFVNSDAYKYAEFIPVPVVASEETPGTPGPFVVTFLDSNGNTVSVQKVPYQGSAIAPSSNYSNFTNITEHKDIKPNSCSAGTVGYKVPNTADR